jgi:hypothetical protein
MKSKILLLLIVLLVGCVDENRPESPPPGTVCKVSGERVVVNGAYLYSGDSKGYVIWVTYLDMKFEDPLKMYVSASLLKCGVNELYEY